MKRSRKFAAAERLAWWLPELAGRAPPTTQKELYRALHKLGWRWDGVGWTQIGKKKNA